MNKKIISFVSFILSFFILANTFIEPVAYAASITATVGLFIFGAILIAGGVYVANRADLQILYDMYLNTLSSVEDYIQWCKIKYATGLALGRYVWDKADTYVSSIINFVKTHMPKVGINVVNDNREFVNVGDGIRDYSIGDSPYKYRMKVGDSIYFNLGDNQVCITATKDGYFCYPYVYFNGHLIYSDNSYRIDEDKRLLHNVIVTRLYLDIDDNIAELCCYLHMPYVDTYGYISYRHARLRIGIGDIYDGVRIDPIDSVTVYNDKVGIVGDGSISHINDITLPYINVDEFGAYYDEDRDVYTYPVDDIDSFVDVLEQSGALDRVIDKYLELGREGVNSVPLTQVRENSGVIEWDNVYVDTVDESVPITGILPKIFLPSGDYTLDFSPLYDISISDKFPFCIPFDFVESVKVFSQSAEQPSFIIDLNTSFFSIYHEIDIGPYMFYIQFFRYVVIAWFIYILISKTRDFIKW